MAIEAKVVWSEGIFITPQHFQQFERYLESGLRQLAVSQEGHFWGFSSLVLNSDGLKRSSGPSEKQKRKPAARPVSILTAVFPGRSRRCFP